MSATNISRHRRRQKGRSAAETAGPDAEQANDLANTLFRNERFAQALSEAIARQVTEVDPLIPLDEVKRIAGLGKTMIYAMVRAGTFPAPFKPGGAATRWSLAEVLEWRRSLGRYKP